MSKYYLSVSTILRNEHLYLHEWITWNLKQGINHFYLYNNSEPGEPDQKEVVKEYNEYITWVDLPGSIKQRESVDHTILNYKDETELVLFTDCDEFIFSPVAPRVVDILPNYFDDLEVSTLAVHWLLFGSNNLEEYSPEPVVKRFTKRAAEVNPHIKSIVRLKDAYGMGSNVHTIRTSGLTIDENFNMLPTEYALSYPASVNILGIAHYVTKSRAECTLRRGMPRSDTGELREGSFFDSHNCNDVEDLRLSDL